MSIVRGLKVTAEIINAWQSSAGATGAGDIYNRYYRLIEFCDPRKPDPCNNTIYLTTSYITVLLSMMHGVLHTMADLPAIRRSPDLARRVDKIFNTWNISTDLLGKYSYLTQNLFFLYTVSELGKFDPTDPKEVVISDAWITGFAFLAAALSLLCNTQLRKSLRFPDDSPRIVHQITNRSSDFVFEGINGYLSGRAFVATIQRIHDLYDPDRSWHNSRNGFVSRMSYGAAWGVLNGALCAYFKPEFTVGDMFGTRADDRFNSLQKVTSSVNSLFNALVFGVFTGIQISNNESTHKYTQAALLSALAAYIAIYYILIRCCCGDDNNNGYQAFPDEDDHDQGHSARNKNSLEKTQSKDQQITKNKLPESGFGISESSILFDKDKLAVLHTHGLIKNSFFNANKIKSQDRKALARMLTRRNNKDLLNVPAYRKKKIC